MSFNVGPTSRRNVAAKSRVEAMIAILRENADEINAPETLRVEFNCGADGFTFKAERTFRIVASVPVAVGVSG